MSSALFILDKKAHPLIYRSYRGDVSQNVPLMFKEHVIDADESMVTPVFEVAGHIYTFIRENDVYLVLYSTINSYCLQDICFLRRCVAIFESYFKRVNEEVIRDNFVMVYELLDEVCDFGYPQFTEEKVLKEYITQESIISKYITSSIGGDNLQAKKLPAAVTGTGGATPWRMPGKYHYRKNEMFLDVTESVNLLVSSEGETLSSEIVGKVVVNCKLSGMPTCRMGLNDKVFLDIVGRRSYGAKTVEMEDVKLHQCVRLNQFERDRVISFIPPDGRFELMTYRLQKKVPPIITVESDIIRHGKSRVEILCKARSNYSRNTIASTVVVIIPVPSDADTPEGTCTLGAIKYAPQHSQLLWTFENLAGQKEMTSRIQFHLPSVRATDESGGNGNAYLQKYPPLAVKFHIPCFVPSGFKVRYVKVTEASHYDTVPWVRYVTESGDYQIRTN